MTAYRIERAPTAFSVNRQRRKRKEEPEHLEFIRGCPCVICGSRRAVEAAHLRTANARYAKPESGMQNKADDKWTLPLCHTHHMEQHDAGDEMAFWSRYGIDPFVLALSLYGVSGDEEAATQIIRALRPIAQEQS